MEQGVTKANALKTIDQKGKGNPFDPGSYGEIVKPGELIDIIELQPLTLSDRRIYNMLLANAWGRIDQPIQHAISKAALKGSHQGHERVSASIIRLMGTIVLAQVRDPKTRKARRVRVQLLGANVEELEQDGMIYYTIPAELIEILKNSEVYARLKTQVMYCFESKYSLLLYEMVERRIGLSYTQSEEFTVRELRELLNVPRGKLDRYADFNKYCLKVAQNEVNKLCGFAVEFTPVKIGRKVERVRMMWMPKTGDGKRQAQSLLDSHSVVRRARMKSGFPDLPLLVDTAPFEER